MPLLSLSKNDNQSVFIDQLCNIIRDNFDGSEKILPAFEWCSNEIICNINEHAEAAFAFICIQTLPKKKKINIAIGDNGIGVLQSLASKYKPESNQEALSLALQRGVSCSENSGRGNGLAGSKVIVELNNGKFHLASGDSIVKINKGEQKFVKIPLVMGTFHSRA